MAAPLVGPEAHGITIRGENLTFRIDEGVGATARGGVEDDRVSVDLAGHSGVEVLSRCTLSGLELTAAGTRGGGGGSGEGAVLVHVGDTEPDERRVVLIEEDGEFTWGLPDGSGLVRLPVEPVPGSRGFISKAVHSVLRVVALKTVGVVVGAGTKALVGRWDEKNHEYGLRPWTPQDFHKATKERPDYARLAEKPALLVIHGFMGSIHGSFGSLSPDVVAGFHRAYDGRTLAFDHPTWVPSPKENAEKLLEILDKADAGPLTVDILCHSRGGLVARELAQRLKDPRLQVRAINFVATPNAGTPLGDPERPAALLDAVTRLASWVPVAGDAFEVALELVKDIVFGSVLGSLAGLVSMNPSGPYLKTLNALDLPEDLVLRSISADFEPRNDAGIVRTARDLLVDTYFGAARNDLIVPTLSTIVTDGKFGVRAGNRLVLDSSWGVDHSTFWTNKRALRQLSDWVRPDTKVKPPVRVPDAETEVQAEIALPPDMLTLEKVTASIADLAPKAKAALEQLVGGPITTTKRVDAAKGTVIVLPGIMGTHLRGGDGELIWVDPLRLARGHFPELIWGATGIEPSGLNRTYLPLVTRLAHRWDVFLAPYDWRADIRTSAQALGERVKKEILDADDTRPVHIVAHSMGGLVARSMAVERDDVWGEMGNPRRGKGSGRLVMLGTPNKGSYAMVLALLGEDMVVKGLAAIDGKNKVERLRDVIATFPGVYQMLPAKDAAPDDDEHEALYSAANWPPGTKVDQALLDKAVAFHEQLRDVGDPERLVYVAGYGHPTPFRFERTPSGAFTLGKWSRGDGRVALALGDLGSKVALRFSTAKHGGLPGAPDVLNSIDALLTSPDFNPTGPHTDERLPVLGTTEPVRRGVDDLRRPPMVPAEYFDPEPAGATRGEVAVTHWRNAGRLLDEALTTTLGGGAPPSDQARVSVRVLHASLEQARHPVAVGHFTGLPPGGSERFLDTKLGGALRARQRLGQYPERPGAALYVAAPPGRRPSGGVVLGLGDFGSLTVATLVEAMCNATVAVILDRRDHLGADEPGLPVEPGEPDDDANELGISAVLVGTPGRRGVSIENAVVALVEGVLTAIRRIDTESPESRPDRLELEIVELYEQPAEQAALAVTRLPQLLDPDLLGRVELRVGDRIDSGDGRRPGAPQEGQSGTPWVRVLAEINDPPSSADGTAIDSPVRTMSFSTLTRGAQSNILQHDLDLEAVREYVAGAIGHSDRSQQVGVTLYEMLFPRRAKLELDRSESMHLLVDKHLAAIPWELLRGSSAGGELEPLALRAGLLRQLRSEDQTRERSIGPAGRSVLFIGDPPTIYNPLPGARREATEAADLFENQGWDVERRIYGPQETAGADKWQEILDALYAKCYRVVHVASHGMLDEDEPRRSGAVIGPKPHQRLHAMAFEAMTTTPDLVFLNCCHLGHIDSLLNRSEAERRALSQPHQVAATVARQLLQNGVSAVVVAGWEVDDTAALAFSQCLYELLLEGYTFGDAVRQARITAHRADGGRTNTWGAYQCYGDPDFELATDDPVQHVRPTVVGASQLVHQLNLAAAQAGTSTSAAHLEEIAAHIDDLVEAGRAFGSDGRVLEALGGAYGELGKYERAIDAYGRALQDERGDVSLHALEQLANFQSRWAQELVRTEPTRRADAVKLFRKAETTLDRVVALAGDTAERWALRGGLHKRRATVLEGPHRHAAVVEAARAYGEAWKLGGGAEAKRMEPYHTNLWLQLVVLTSANGELTPAKKKILTALYRQVVDEAKTSTDYWETAAVADTVVTCALAGGPIDGIVLQYGAAEQEYRKAWALRSSMRQRDSVLGHLEDLVDLVRPERVDELKKLVNTLRNGVGSAGG